MSSTAIVPGRWTLYNNDPSSYQCSASLLCCRPCLETRSPSISASPGVSANQLADCPGAGAGFLTVEDYPWVLVAADSTDCRRLEVESLCMVAQAAGGGVYMYDSTDWRWLEVESICMTAQTADGWRWSLYIWQHRLQMTWGGVYMYDTADCWMWRPDALPSICMTAQTAGGGGQTLHCLYVWQHRLQTAGGGGQTLHCLYVWQHRLLEVEARRSTVYMYDTTDCWRWRPDAPLSICMTAQTVDGWRWRPDAPLSICMTAQTAGCGARRSTVYMYDSTDCWRWRPDAPLSICMTAQTAGWWRPDAPLSICMTAQTAGCGGQTLHCLYVWQHRLLDVEARHSTVYMYDSTDCWMWRPDTPLSICMTAQTAGCGGQTLHCLYVWQHRLLEVEARRSTVYMYGSTDCWMWRPDAGGQYGSTDLDVEARRSTVYVWQHSCRQTDSTDAGCGGQTLHCLYVWQHRLLDVEARCSTVYMYDSTDCWMWRPDAPLSICMTAQTAGCGGQMLHCLYVWQHRLLDVEAAPLSICMTAQTAGCGGQMLHRLYVWQHRLLDVEARRSTVYMYDSADCWMWRPDAPPSICMTAQTAGCGGQTLHRLYVWQHRLLDVEARRSTVYMYDSADCWMWRPDAPPSICMTAQTAGCGGQTLHRLYVWQHRLLDVEARRSTVYMYDSADCWMWRPDAPPSICMTAQTAGCGGQTLHRLYVWQRRLLDVEARRSTVYMYDSADCWMWRPDAPPSICMTAQTAGCGGQTLHRLYVWQRRLLDVEARRSTVYMYDSTDCRMWRPDAPPYMTDRLQTTGCGGQTLHSLYVWQRRLLDVEARRSTVWQHRLQTTGCGGQTLHSLYVWQRRRLDVEARRSTVYLWGVAWWSSSGGWLPAEQMNTGTHPLEGTTKVPLRTQVHGNHSRWVSGGIERGWLVTIVTTGSDILMTSRSRPAHHNI